jgi:hypothetical protein
MNTHADKTQENKTQSVSALDSQMQSDGECTFQFVDNRPEAVAQLKLQEMANNSSQVKQLEAFQEMANNSAQTKQTAQLQAMYDNHSAQKQQLIQKKENKTGLPDNLKTGMENLSRMSLDDVKVHRNSDKPSQLQAHAYAQGTDIHLGAGQEKYLPHEAWHVVQQKQGRVKPTMQMKSKVNVNDDEGLEREADVMGQRALQAKHNNEVVQPRLMGRSDIIQRVEDKTLRGSTDPEVEALVWRTRFIIEQLSAKGTSWEETWKSQATKSVQDKADSVLSGEKAKESPSIERRIVDRLWKEVPFETKVELAYEGARAGIRILGAAFKQSSVESSERSSERSSGLPGLGVVATGVKNGAVEAFSELTMDDLKMLYQVMKKKREVENKLEEVKTKISGELASASGSVAGKVGETRDEIEFASLIKDLKPEFATALDTYQALKMKILNNKDAARYNNELAAIQDALEDPPGPWLAMFTSGQTSAEYRLRFPELCRERLADLKQAERDIIDEEEREVELDIIDKGINFLKGKSGPKTKTKTVRTDAPKQGDAATPVAREGAASALRRALRADWSPVTKWWKIPNGVKEIKKLESSLDTAEYLSSAKSLAKGVGTAGKNRNPITQEFYKALSEMNPDDVSSLKLARSAFMNTLTELEGKKSKKNLSKQEESDRQLGQDIAVDGAKHLGRLL